MIKELVGGPLPVGVIATGVTKTSEVTSTTGGEALDDEVDRIIPEDAVALEDVEVGFACGAGGVTDGCVVAEADAPSAVEELAGAAFDVLDVDAFAGELVVLSLEPSGQPPGTQAFTEQHPLKYSTLSALQIYDCSPKPHEGLAGDILLKGLKGK